MQVWPVAAKIPAITPLTAASMSASGKMMFGDLPPSSRVTSAMWSAALFITAMPVAVDPVKVTLSTPGSAVSAAPVSPAPVTTLKTPGGNPASSTSLANSSVDDGVCSAGLATTVHPAARAGASLLASRNSGLFQGRMAATTPMGSRRV